MSHGVRAKFDNSKKILVMGVRGKTPCSLSSKPSFSKPELQASDFLTSEEKRVYLNLLRHGSITRNAKALPDQLLKKCYGWAKG
jgi:hypothetical protein